ncbi:hypothetical protein DDB_G0268520 [Dictyostelium discoideum AX4]|uniref:Cytosolic endo-beta-N-acetylglucosaminidase TIM barrel domain-containing protein n=1 Tax=Dictyostelium discoideum TaxID=44689 RepID=Q55G89_DICDI|nr:hypothetical protein DDB_G0268520 [Dictyostelium discoideum AX4]EAL73713.1 hypothetical protein DDB_G0268520 [Dictyostelium discoideum AX4]|eukprot:XP_647295.1 hypothetical protein DDB_G0268520 [Dictyostelium discoideum AX4]
MKTKKLIDNIKLGSNNKNNNNNGSEIIIPWNSILMCEEFNREENHIDSTKSISISCWIYMIPNEDDNRDDNNRVNRIFSQLQNNNIDTGIFFGNQSFDKRLYNDSTTTNRTSIHSIYHTSKDELKYFHWEFLIFKLNFNDSGTQLISTEIYLNCKIYKQTNYCEKNNNHSNLNNENNNTINETYESPINISKSPLIIGSKDLSNEMILSDLTIHLNDRHDILSTIFQNNSILKQPSYPPNIQNKSLLGNSFISTIKPLNSILELLNWKSTINPQQQIQHQQQQQQQQQQQNYNDLINISTIKLNKRIKKSNNITKRIHCHDMMNGYQIDKYCQGIYEGINDRKTLWSSEFYNFYHWNLIDTFIYFSHHRISIPPVGWINSAHKNGVKVLGTIILEWDQSLSDCYLLVDGIQEDVNHFINKLIEISNHFKFDGWFLNLETSLLDHPSYVEKYISFLKNFTNSIHKNSIIIGGGSSDSGSVGGDIHEDNDEKPLIIWYDSVTSNGELNWQNELNEKNYRFFENCDGIFLNYCWNKDNLKNSFNIISNLNNNKDDCNDEEINEKCKNVYVGTDCWGRGTFGGGKFNSWIGLKEADLNQLSSAIFAPAWTYEDANSSSKMVIEREKSFWLGSLVQNLVENGSAEYGNFSTWSPIFNTTTNTNNNNNNNNRYHWVIDNNGLLNGNGKSFKSIKSSRYDSKFFSIFKKRIDLFNISKNDNNNNNNNNRILMFTKEILDKLPMIEFEFYYKSTSSINQTDSNNYPVNLIMLDENLTVLKEFNTQCLSKVRNEWKKYKLTIREYPIGIRFIDIIINNTSDNDEISISGINLQIIAKPIYKSKQQQKTTTTLNSDDDHDDDNNNNNNYNSIRSVTDERISIHSLPFSSCFNRGKGKKYWINGKIVSNSKWFNLSDQDIIGCEEDYRYQIGSKLILSTTSYSVSFNGGSSLNIKGKLETISNIGNNQFKHYSINNNNNNNNDDDDDKYSISTLFKTDIKLKEKQLLISYTWSVKSIPKIQLSEQISKLCLILVFSDNEEKNIKNIILHPSTLGNSIDNKQQIFPFNINTATNNQNEYIIYESDQDEIINAHLDWYQSKFCLNIDDFIFNNTNKNNNIIKLKEIKSFSYNFKSNSIDRNSIPNPNSNPNSNNQDKKIDSKDDNSITSDGNNKKDKLDQYNVYIGEVTLDTISCDHHTIANNNNSSSSLVEIKSCNIDKVWNINSLSGGGGSDQYDIILNWIYEIKKNIQNGDNHDEDGDNIIKCTNIYLDEKWVGRSYNNNYYIIKSKEISQNSFITIEFINHLNNLIYSKNFNLFD